jgi:hypothetical protein
MRALRFGVFMRVSTFMWNLEKLAQELHIPSADTLTYFQDGRRASFIVERRLAFEYLKGRIADSEGAGYDVFDQSGKKWEVRCLTKGGMYFCPSYMKGSGRKFEENGFLEKLDEIEGYLIGRITNFPEVPVYEINKSQVYKWWKSGELGTTSKISLKKAELLFANS